jgi:hypothetical protein
MINRPIDTFAVYSRPQPIARPRVWVPLAAVLVVVTLAWAWWQFMMR